MNLITTLFLTSILSASAFAERGGVDSGGGKAIVCRDTSGRIQSAELLDLFEGRVLFKREALESNADYATQLADITARFKDQTAGGAPYLDQLGGRVQTIFTTDSLIPQGMVLEPTDDAIQIIVPRGCKLEQAASYNTRLQRLFVDSEIWASMNETNRAALILHEALYDGFRLYADEVDSFYTRQVVSLVMSMTSLPSPVDGLPKDAYLCGDYIGATKFFIYDRADGEVGIQWLSVNKLPIFVPTKNVILGAKGRITAAEISSGKKNSASPDIHLAVKFNVGAGSPVNSGWAQNFYAGYSHNHVWHYFQLFRPGQSGDSSYRTSSSCQKL
jgi:hypothetical protein